jgi:RNA polymerase sigma-70 factor (ECF subfamily)
MGKEEKAEVEGRVEFQARLVQRDIIEYQREHMSLDFDSVYNEFHPRILRYVSKMTNPDEAEDITQDIFIKVHRSLAGFKGESSLSTWIYRIATNTALDRLRATSRKSSNPISESELEAMDQNVWTDEKKSGSEDEIVRNEMNECIREFIERLPSDYKTVMLLSKLDGMKNSEIAEILDISIETVKIRLHRGRTRLKKELEKGCDFYQDEQRGLSCDRKSSPNQGPIQISIKKSK